MPGDRGKMIDVRERRVKEEIAKQQLKQDTEINERIGDEVINNVVPFEKACEESGYGVDRTFEVHEGLGQVYKDELKR